MPIKEIKGKYLIKADRLMVTVVNTDASLFKIILTRRVTKIIADTFNEYILKSSESDELVFVSEDIKKFNKEYILRDISFGEKNAAETEEDKKSPLQFVSDVKFKKPPRDQKCLVLLCLNINHHHEIKISCNLKLMNIFNELMSKLEKKTLWQVMKSEPNQEVIEPVKKRKKLLH
jgi:hypothetical protein